MSPLAVSTSTAVRSPREHQVLEQLITRAGQPLRKRQLADAVSTLDESLNEDALEIYVHRLRRKLAGSGAVIHTLRGLGYVLEPADEAAE